MLKEHCELLKRAVKIQHIREHTILKRVDEGKQEDDERVQELQKQLVATEHEHQKKSQELQQVKQLLSQSQVEIRMLEVCVVCLHGGNLTIFFYRLSVFN